MMERTGHRETVLFCGPIDNPLNSGRYIISALKKLGYNVIGFDYRTQDNHEAKLRTIIAEQRPHTVFTFKGEQIPPYLIEQFRNSGSQTILWYVDYPLDEWVVQLARVHDFVVTSCEYYIKYLSKRGVSRVSWIHQGFAPDFFGINGSFSDSVDRYYADVAMIGSMGNPQYKRRCDVLMKVKRHGINVKWWGPHLSHQLKNMRFFLSGIHRLWAGRQVHMKEFADIIRHTKIFLGEDANDIPLGTCLSNRPFAVMGCGGFYLCRRTPGIEYVFEIGTELDVYETDDEMLDKIQFYLRNKTVREKIARKGQLKVLSSYTYVQQVKKIMDGMDKHSYEKTLPRTD